MFAPCALRAATAVRVVGSQLMEPLIEDAAQILRSENNIQVQIVPGAGISAALMALEEQKADVVMVSRAIVPADHADHPAITFNEIQIGEQIVAFGVARDVWAGGVHALTREQLKAIYESKITNWRAVGGADQKIAFFNFEEGQSGVWELFAQWLYGDTRRAPAGRFQVVSTFAEARDTVEFTAGAMVLISPLLVDGQRSFALAIKEADGKTLEPTPQAALAKTYPLARPLLLVTNDKPTGRTKVLVDFLLSARGQELLKKRGFYGADAIKQAGGEAR